MKQPFRFICLATSLQVGFISCAQAALQDVPEGQYLLPVGAPRARLLSALPTRATRRHEEHTHSGTVLLPSVHCHAPCSRGRGSVCDPLAPRHERPAARQPATSSPLCTAYTYNTQARGTHTQWYRAAALDALPLAVPSPCATAQFMAGTTSRPTTFQNNPQALNVR